MNDHNTKEEIRKIKYSAGHIAATRDENPPGGGGLLLMGIVLGGSVQKTPGTEVTLDSTGDRTLTSYSATESSWASTRERYG